MKKFLFLICFLVLARFTVIGQSVTYYPFSSMLSLSTNPTQPGWLDLRIQTNSFSSSLATEIAPAFNLNTNPKARFYVGGGARFNFLAASIENRDALEGLFLNVGLRSALFEKYPGIQIAFELSPYANSDFDLGTFRANLGIGYNFSKKKKK